jgi:serine protease inhibitor
LARGRIFAKPGLQEFCVAYGQRDNSTHLLLLNALRRAHRGVQRVWLSEDGKAACLEVDAAAEDAVVEAVLRDLTPVHVYLLPRGPVIRLDSGASADAVQPSIELDEGPTRHQTVAAQFALVRALIDTQPTQRNFFCSPAPLYAALCAAALAATPSSETAAQLLRLFRPVTSPLAAARASGMIGTAIPNLHVANALFFFAPHGGASSVNDAFAESLSAQMGAHALPARSASDVNARCEAQTHGALRQVLTDRDVTSDTMMVLVNAVLFRGKWRFPFKLRNSKELALWTSDTVRDQRAVFMSKGFGAYGKDAKRLHAGVVGDGTAACARAVCVPYADVDAEAWFILPEEPGDAALGRVGRALPQLWDDIEALHAAEPRVVDLTCPRFNIDTGCMDVVPALRALGAKAPFEPCAGFLNATPDRTACLTAVAQRISCTVDETGTVAAGCSAAVICTRGFGGSSWAPEAFEVELTRPFWIVLIVRISGGIVPMFIGRVMTPSAA